MHDDDIKNNMRFITRKYGGVILSKNKKLHLKTFESVVLTYNVIDLYYYLV